MKATLDDKDIPLDKTDLNDLGHARQLLEGLGLAAYMTNLIGTPIERGLELLPAGWSGRIGDLTRTALIKAADAAIFTRDGTPEDSDAERWHKWDIPLTGGEGGFFGLAGLAVELPLSTTLMMRSIAAIARGEGESLQAMDTRKACLSVFALGGKSESNEATGSGYYAVRMALAQAASQAADHLGTQTQEEGVAAPAIARLISVVANRFGIQVTEKVAAQAIPALGAAGGALVNTLFMGHFQDMARGHFTVRRLDRKYGADVVHAAYLALGGSQMPAPKSPSPYGATHAAGGTSSRRPAAPWRASHWCALNAATST